MMEKYKLAHFGKCPRVNCYFNPLLPVGLYDVAGQSSVKLYCTKCEDLYIPKSTRHANIDGAYFGTSFPAMILQAFPNCFPPRPTRDTSPQSLDSRCTSTQSGPDGRTNSGRR